MDHAPFPMGSCDPPADPDPLCTEPPLAHMESVDFEDLLDFFENASVALHWVAGDGTILRANQAELDMMGYAAEEYVGRNIAEFHVDPDVADEILSRLKAGEVLRNHPARLVTRDGHIRHVAIDSSALRRNGKFLHTRCVTRDITEQVAHAAEIRALHRDLSNTAAELESVLAVVPIGIGIAYDPHCRDIRVNPAFAEQLGIDPGMNASKSSSQADALPFVVMKDGMEVAPENLPMQRAARERVTVRGEEIDIVHQDGRVIRLLVYAAPLIGPGGKVRGSVGAFVDITERRQLELERELLFEGERVARREAEASQAEAERARESAEAASRAKSDFLALVSHELRTPLNAIGGYVDLLEMGLRGPLTPEQRSDLGRLQHNQRHLLMLINQVLNYARIETRTLYYQIEAVSLSDVLVSLEALVRPQMDAKGLGFRLELPEVDVEVRADRDKLMQILINLLSNAAKFNDRGRSVVVTCETVNGAARVQVVDDGRGIPSSELERIFEPFVQVASGLTRTDEGVGLGLAISRDLARGMGGDLTVDSRQGEGSKFTLRLPLVSTSQREERPPAR